MYIQNGYPLARDKWIVHVPNGVFWNVHNAKWEYFDAWLFSSILLQFHIFLKYIANAIDLLYLINC